MIPVSQWDKDTLPLYRFISYLLKRFIPKPLNQLVRRSIYFPTIMCIFRDWFAWWLILLVSTHWRENTQPCFILVDFHVTESQTVLNVSKGEAKPTRADPLVNRVPEGKAKSLPGHGKEWIMMAGG